MASYSSADSQSSKKVVSFQATRSCGTSKSVNFTALAEQEKSYLTDNPFTPKSFKANTGAGKSSTNDVLTGIPVVSVYFHVIIGKFFKETPVLLT
jgi:hypothetical protein